LADEVAVTLLPAGGSFLALEFSDHWLESHLLMPLHPESQRDLRGDEFRRAVQDHLIAEFIDGAGAAEVVITGDRIIIRWVDTAEAGPMTGRGIEFPKAGDYKKGITTLRMAVALNPNDGYSHKNLGAILSRSGARAEGIKQLRRATELLPSDPATWLNFGLALEDDDELAEADEAYLKVIALDPTGQIGQRAERGRSQIAEKTFRGRGGDLRADAFSYCLGALERFEGMPKSEIQKITFEIAMLGRRGLDVNDPAQKYSLTSVSGTFSGLQLLCIEYVGFQLVDPSVDIGFDLSAEYAEARKAHGTR
jgi:tetratricopeptide (TPR) repeat protein